MTDKEMLEEIKRSINKQWREIQPDVLDVVYLDISEIDWLLEQAERTVAGEQQYVLKLKQRIAILEQRNKRISDGAIKLQEENIQYKQALEFYADEENYKENLISEAEQIDGNWVEPAHYEPPIIYFDKGQIARQALEGKE